MILFDWAGDGGASAVLVACQDGKRNGQHFSHAVEFWILDA